MLELLILTICSTLLFGLVYFFLIQSLIGVPYVPSAAKSMRTALEQLDLQDKKFLDLGSGDGLVVLTAARLGAQAAGVEINPALVLASKLRARMRGVSAKFHRGSYTTFPIGDADVIYLYVLPKTMDKLLPRLQAEMKPGSIVISNTFKFAQLQPEQVLNQNFLVYRLSPSLE